MIKPYIDLNDWWVGVYRGPHHYYICVIPCIVFKINRNRKKPDKFRLEVSNPATLEWLREYRKILNRAIESGEFDA